MKKNTFLLVSILLLSAAWTMAQNGADRNDQTSGGHVTVEGCLSEAGGNFMLTSQSGMSYQLTGNTDRLQDHVGQTIRVKGFGTSEAGVAPSSMSEGADAADANAPAQQAPPMLSVSSFKRVSSNCGTSGGGGY
ncbi:MAG: DUF5818 domain-containing protein [Candidatus Korobacteraceae bacterium]